MTIALRLGLMAGVIGLVPAAWARAEDQTAGMADREALSALQSMVGVWRGGAQPKRGTTKGSWVEKAEWSWHYSSEAASITFTAPESRLYVAGRIVPGDKPGAYRLFARAPEAEEEDSFTGELKEETRLVFQADRPRPGKPAAISMRLVAEGKRLVMIYHEKAANADRLLLMAEVGYTRQGSGFGRAGETPECVLTGGEASIPVTYKGQTYYVCCSGCRDYFIENPEKVLAQYRERMAKKQKAKAP